MWEIIPNPGITKIYTSGWPKNQNRCWNRIGSPPPAGSKKEVFRFRSVRSIVMAPASTGNERSRRSAVIKMAQANRGVRIITIFSLRMLIIVVIKLIEPKIDEIPARWSEKIARSTDGPLCEMLDDSGG